MLAILFVGGVTYITELRTLGPMLGRQQRCYLEKSGDSDQVIIFAVGLVRIK